MTIGQAGSGPIDETGPRMLGRYQLIEKIASGGMGEVYLGAAKGPAGFEKHVAIKRILPHLADNEEFVRRFIDEARIVVNLTHGNIVPVLDMGVDGGEYFIAMEHIAGTDLRAAMKQVAKTGKAVPPMLAAYITAEICRGLSYAHRKADDRGKDLRIIHRDVSPSNVLLSWEGMVKLTDFGVASAIGRLADSLVGSLRGKISYMSPEQAAGERVDKRTDMYSAGIVLWEMLTGRRLFEGETDTEVLRLVRDGEVEHPASHRPGIPAELDRIAMQALSKDRTQRYGSMEAMEGDLLRLLYAAQEEAMGASALAEFLRELFEERALSSPGLLSLDDALREGLDDLSGGTTRSQTLGEDVVPTPSEGLAPEAGLSTSPTATASWLADSGAPAPAAAAAAAPSTARWLLPLVLAGIAGGYLAARPGGGVSGGMEVTSSPTGASVSLDGVPIGVTPWAASGLPADRLLSLEVTAPGHLSFRRSVRVNPGARGVHTVTLAPSGGSATDAEPAPVPGSPLLAAGRKPWERPASAAEVLPGEAASSPDEPRARRKPAKRRAASRETGTLFVRVKPTGQIVINGKRWPSPLMGHELPAGTHVIRVENKEQGLGPRNVKVKVRPGQETRTVIDLLDTAGGAP